MCVYEDGMLQSQTNPWHYENGTKDLRQSKTLVQPRNTENHPKASPTKFKQYSDI